VELDSRQLELIALSLFAALGCGVAWTLDQNFIAAIFAGESAAALVAAILRLK
jgi:alkylhydroperoxidase/carboxymuconolactone decarboxylase family protein YurZ